MPTYNGVSFDVLSTDRSMRPHWERETVWASQHIPFSDRDDLQYGGRSHERIVLPVLVQGDEAMAALRESVGVCRTLFGLFGTDYQNVVLKRVGEQRRSPTQALWTAQLEFEKVG